MRPIAPLAVVLLALLPAGADAWTWPARGEVLTFFDHSPGSYARGMHRGIDIAARPGTAVRAARPGRVAFAGVAGDSGLSLSVLDAARRLRVTYLHLRSVAARPGERVREGQVIARSGASGRGSAARPHLHLGVRREGEGDGYVDPLSLLPPSGVPGAAPPAGAPAREPRPVASPRPRRPLPRPARALDPGWAVACLALLGAAAALGRRATRPARARAARGGTPAPARQAAASSIAGTWPTTSQRRSTT